MIMYNVLLILFRVANIAAAALLLISYVFTFITKKKLGKFPTAKIVLPLFSEQHVLVKHCFWSGTVFIVLDWLLCSSSAITVSQTASNSLSQGLLLFGIIWAAMIFVGIVFEVMLKFIKTTSTVNTSLAKGIKSAIAYSVLYFVLSFLVG